jgi:serine/threonine protein phosphatase PrpC
LHIVCDDETKDDGCFLRRFAAERPELSMTWDRYPLMTLQFNAGSVTDVGRERAENQDAVGETHLDEVSFWYVCDGMGGHLGGSTASRLAIEALDSVLSEPEADLRKAINAALQEANRRIHEVAQAKHELRNMGTTAVLVAFDKTTGQVTVAHVGDSRAYLLRDKTIRLLTRDHTMVQRLVDDGVIEPEQAENHPHSNYISRSLGGREEVEVEFNPEPIEFKDGDIFMTCSDGLHGLVREPVIAASMAVLAPEEAAQKLIDLANEAGGHDNISAQVILIGETPEAHAASEYTVQRPPRLLRKPAPAEDIDFGATPIDGTDLNKMLNGGTGGTPEPAQLPATFREGASATPDDEELPAPILAALVLGAAVLALFVYMMVQR